MTRQDTGARPGRTHITASALESQATSAYETRGSASGHKGADLSVTASQTQSQTLQRQQRPQQGGVLPGLPLETC